MTAAQLAGNPLQTPSARPQAQHLRHVIRRLHHLPPWITPRPAFSDSFLLHSLSPQLSEEGAIPRDAERAVFHGARQACRNVCGFPLSLAGRFSTAKISNQSPSDITTFKCIRHSEGSSVVWLGGYLPPASTNPRPAPSHRGYDIRGVGGSNLANSTGPSQSSSGLLWTSCWA